MRHPESQKLIDAGVELLTDHLRDFAAEAPHGARIAFDQLDIGQVADNLHETMLEDYDGEWPDEDRIIRYAREYIEAL